MDINDFNYELPQELIAQEPVEDRDESRLLVLDKNTGCIQHKIFKNIIEYLNPNDCLVLNDTRVIPARLFGVKEKTKGKIEIVLLKRIDIDTWEVILKPGRKAKPGARFIFGNGELVGEILEIVDDGNRIIKFYYDGVFEQILDTLGNMPLPPYITKQLADKERYQTVYSREKGSAAAPTAGLHFTNKLLEDICAKGINVAFVTLHVGLGTFRPVKVEDITKHKMHSEFFDIPQETANLINQTREHGRRVVAVGTTTCRTLETATDNNGKVASKSGWTNIFIYPGYNFKIVDALITNFHLPQSTLLMLISAFASTDNILKAYKVAVEQKYRFFSFGDAMFIK